MKTLETLEQLGEEFKDYKHWDLEVDELGYRVVGKGALDGAYRDIGKPNGSEKCCTTYFNVPVMADRYANKGQIIGKNLNYQTSEEANSAFLKICDTTNQLETTAAFLRELETISARKAYEEAMKLNAEQAQTDKINNLLGKFGVDA